MRQGLRDGRTVTLRGLWTHPRSGRHYYRTRRDGKTVLVPLPELPTDHPDFIAAWAEAARKGAAEPKPAAGTIASIWNAALASEQAHAWSTSYRSIIRRQAKLIVAKAGQVQGRAVREQHVRKDVTEAPNPPERLKAWRFWAQWAVGRGIIPTDPTSAVRAPRTAPSDGYPPWTPDHVAAFRARWPIGTVARAAMELMFWCGCRVSDAVLIGPQMVGRDGVLSFRQKKTGDQAFVPWTCPLPDYAVGQGRDRDLCHAALAPFVGHLTFLATVQGKTRSPKALSTLMQDACKAAKIPVSSHGLRKARAVALVEGGATAHQCGAWTGHYTLAEVTRYTRAMDRRRAVMG